MSSADSNLTVSLEPHLSQVLNPLPEILPPELGSRLSSELLRPEIHYALLSDISKWSRSEAGRAALMHHNLQASSYSMISLLAGSVTSPFSRPPPHVRPESARHVAGRELNDKKAITAILNALLSVVGSGAATWWAANQSGWRDEWVRSFRILLSLSGQTVLICSCRKFCCHSSWRWSWLYRRLFCTSYGSPGSQRRSNDL